MLRKQVFPEATLAQLDRFLYPLPEASTAPLAVVRWWERRRLRYNLIVGGAGLFSLGVVDAFAVLPPGPHGSGVPLGAVIVFGILANVCYTAGAVIDWGCKLAWRDDPPLVGPFLFRQGLMFSVGLALLPIAVAAVGWGFRLLHVLF